MSEDPKDLNIEDTAEISGYVPTKPVEMSVSTKTDSVGATQADSQVPAGQGMPIPLAADKNKPPDRMEDKKKVWTRRIIGAILFFSVVGCLALLVAAQAVTYLFKTILTP